VSNDFDHLTRVLARDMPRRRALALFGKGILVAATTTPLAVLTRSAAGAAAVCAPPASGRILVLGPGETICTSATHCCIYGDSTGSSACCCPNGTTCGSIINPAGVAVVGCDCPPGKTKCGGGVAEGCESTICCTPPMVCTDIGTPRCECSSGMTECGATCYGVGQTCMDGDCVCASGEEPCGEGCCPAGKCLDPSKGQCYCPPDQDSCGFRCCPKGQCADAQTSTCACPSGQAPCGDGCCPPGQCVDPATAACRCQPEEELCGSVCCPQGQCVDPEKSECECAVGEEGCGEVCCQAGRTCCDPDTSTCCDPGVECCVGYDDRGHCCATGTRCVPIANLPHQGLIPYTCCPTERACKGGCCLEGELCVANAICCPTERACGLGCCGPYFVAKLNPDGSCAGCEYVAPPPSPPLTGPPRPPVVSCPGCVG
jgi:hypothetical protein